MSTADESRFQVAVERQEDFRFTVDFGIDGVPDLSVDEPPPMGDGDGPNAARLLAAAVGNCLSASLLYCLRKSKAEPGGVSATVTGSLARTSRGRLRIPELHVVLSVDAAPGDEGRMERCLDLFEDYCIVTESVRSGIDVLVEVRSEEGGSVDAEDAAVANAVAGD